MRCPTCNQLVSPDESRRFRPFCSERCKLIDLGRWLDGSYAVPGEPASDEDLESGLQDGDEREPRER